MIVVSLFEVNVRSLNPIYLEDQTVFRPLEKHIRTVCYNPNPFQREQWQIFAHESFIPKISWWAASRFRHFVEQVPRVPVDPPQFNSGLIKKWSLDNLLKLYTKFNQVSTWKFEVIYLHGNVGSDRGPYQCGIKSLITMWQNCSPSST